MSDLEATLEAKRDHAAYRHDADTDAGHKRYWEGQRDGFDLALRELRAAGVSLPPTDAIEKALKDARWQGVLDRYPGIARCSIEDAANRLVDVPHFATGEANTILRQVPTEAAAILNALAAGVSLPPTDAQIEAAAEAFTKHVKQFPTRPAWDGAIGWDVPVEEAMRVALEAAAGVSLGPSAGENENECASCGQQDPPNECGASRRPCGHHCNHIWTHDCCDWCGAEVGEEGEYQVGAVVAYTLAGEPHLAWREPGANQENDHHWHVFHGMNFGWRTWTEISSGEQLRFLGAHGPGAALGDTPEPREETK